MASERPAGGAVDEVGGDEILYRRVPDGEHFVRPLDGGGFRISSQAFTDRKKRPSVDRAKLRPRGPSETQQGGSDGVARLVARDVRGIEGLHKMKKGRVERRFEVDVLPVPLPDNPAHAEIVCRPRMGDGDRGAFRRLTQRLARLARWEILPASLRPTSRR